MPDAAWGALLAFLLSVILGLVGYIVKTDRKERELDREEDRKERDSDRAIVRDTQRHLDSLIKTVWFLIWRMNGVEDFLADEDHGGYHPPRMIGEAEMFHKDVPS